MPLTVFNTRTRKLERFKPTDDKRVRMFICGPTVYDSSHLGHARTYLAFDIICRYLRFLGYETNVIVNITDVDDAIVAAAKETQRDPVELARQYEREFLEDMQSLGIDSFSEYARASDYIKQIIAQIEILVQKGFAYETKTGVFFDVSSSDAYGKLSGQSAEELSLRRLEPDPEKRNPHDFSLWKKQSQEDGPAWASPWGTGRPGWHIEDTAIAMEFLGPTYDVHGGGLELVFPHHDAEIAQAEAMTGQAPYVRYWLHTGLLKVDGVKMSKSLGNSTYMRELLKNNEPDKLRFFVAKWHYRAIVDYNEADFCEAEKEFLAIRENLGDFRRVTLEGRELSSIEKAALSKLEECWRQFLWAMNDDFDTPRAVASLWEIAHEISEFVAQNPSVSKVFFEGATAMVENAARILGLRTLLS